MSFPKPTWNFCETSMLFQTSGYHMYSRGCVVLQTSNRTKFKKNQEIITCPMYIPSTCTKTVVCTRRGAGQFSWGFLLVHVTRDPCSNYMLHVAFSVNGRCIDVDEQLAIQWMCGTTALDTALQLLFNMCERSWEFPSCICLNNDLNGTNLCKIANQFKPVKYERVFPSANRQDEIEALDRTLPGVVSMYMCQHPLSYT